MDAADKPTAPPRSRPPARTDDPSADLNGTPTPDADIMDVSPAPTADPLAPDHNKENKTDAHREPPSLIAPAPNAHPHLPDAVAHGPHPAPPDDNRDTQFAYVLRKYNTIPDTRVYSPWHNFGSYKWRLLIFPRGNHTSNRDLSVYLECGGPVVRDDPPPQHQHQTQHNPNAPPNGKETAVPITPPTAWSRHAKFSLLLLHPSSAPARAAVESSDLLFDPASVDADAADANNPSSRIQAGARQDMVKDTAHTFRQNVSDWGFLEFAPFSSLQPDSYADNDMNVVLSVKIRLLEQSVDPTFPNQTPWDSRKETGLVGFKNQGATCYMNSLLQTLYMLSAFRKAVYNMPLPEDGNDNSGSELSYALQKVFYELQFSPSVVKTKKLTESFGWDTTDAFTQHDVQELKLILCDELAEKMKKIKPNQPNSLSTLFQGKLLNYIECVNVSYRSTREEEFSDLSLNVKGCQNIYDSFKKYVEVEMMDGDNKYRADGFDELQDARKGVKFLQLPPVLQLHLKRFEYDTTRDAMVKINDRYEFLTEIDLSSFVDNSNDDDVYVLHSVLVHIGDVNGGHYHAFIRPDIDTGDDEYKKPSQWYKFDDETVTCVKEEEAVQDNYGVGGEREFNKRGMDDEINGGLNGANNPPTVFPNRGRNYQQRRSYSNAYMLQYLRKSDVHYLLTSPKEEDVPVALADRIRKEREEEEQRKRDTTIQHLYMNANIATDGDMLEHHETDLVNWPKVRPLRVERATQLGELKLVLQKESFIQDASKIRLWKFAGRNNHTIRPDSLVANGDDSQPIEPNVRDPLTGGLNGPLYQTRHGLYGQDDGARFYAEDLCSQYCLAGGESFSALVDANGDGDTEVVKSATKMETEQAAVVLPRKPLPLKSGRETMVFLKYYMSKPQAKLQWVGHAIVDRKSTVRDLVPLFRKAVDNFITIHGKDSIAALTPNSELKVYEEVFPSQIKDLEMHQTLEDYQIPCDGGNGDIIVFQEELPALSKDTADDADAQQLQQQQHNHLHYDFRWNGLQEMSRGDGTDEPLGGRPLPSLLMYYDYLQSRIKIEFKDRQTIADGEDGLSIFFELSRKDTYRVARKVLSGALGEDVSPDYIRFFHDSKRDTPEPEPFRLPDNGQIDRMIMDPIVSTGPPEYRTIWYEVTEYPIEDFQRNREVRVVWRPDGGTRCPGYGGTGTGSKTPSPKNTAPNVDMKDATESGGTDMSIDGDTDQQATTPNNGSNNNNSGGKDGGAEINGDTSPAAGVRDAKTFSVLLQGSSKFADVLEQVRIKRGVPSDVELRLLKVMHSRIVEFVDHADLVPAVLDFDTELRVEPVPSDETGEALGEEYKLMSVVHLAKQPSGRGWRPQPRPLFGHPFVIKVRCEGESVDHVLDRVQSKLGVGDEEFKEWRLAEMAQMKPVFLERGTVYKPRMQGAVEYCSLAIEHKNTAPAKRTTSAVSRYTDKPLKIRS